MYPPLLLDSMEKDMRRRQFIRSSVALLLALLPITASAHHSVAALFDRAAIIEAEGEITRVFWRNPHVQLWITDANGKNWQLETTSVSTLERFGIRRDLFVEGHVIRVAGNPSRRSDDSIYTSNVLLADGREVLMGGNVTARWSNETIDSDERVPLAAANVRAAEENADGIFRVWSNSQRPPWTVTRTEAAEAARAVWDASSDDPRLRCVAPGMVDAMTSPYPIGLAEESDDIIVIRMEEWDGVRRIHMNTPDRAQDFPPTPMGYSLGHWEGNTLVVSTNRISWPHFDNEGTPQSENVEVIERFTLSADEQSMSWEAIITDPVNLVESAVVRQSYTWVPGEEIKEFSCALANED